MSEPLVEKAMAALKREDFVEARDCIKAFESQKPLGRNHFLIWGLSEIALKDWIGARILFARAVDRYKEDAQFLFNLGVAEENLGDLKGAALSYEQSLSLKADQADAAGNLSNVYYRLADFDRAEDRARRALALGASTVQALNSLGLALGRQNKRAQAEKAFEEALRIEPDNLIVLCNSANLAADQLNVELALQRFSIARSKGDAPFIRHHEAMTRLLSGDFGVGWPLFEARLETAAGLRVRPNMPRYKGETLIGKTLLLIAEQGFGDVIQFCRYGELLKKEGANLIWVVPQNLKRLLEANLSGTIVSELEQLPAADFYLPILSLPLTLRLFDPKDAPKAPYLRADGNVPSLPNDNVQRKIGIVWAGSKTHERDHERSVPFHLMAALMQAVTAQYYGISPAAELEEHLAPMMIRLAPLIKDFADTAALLNQLDCLVTVDTATAHLAGALGVKTYLLLPYVPDWRWGVEGEATAWYDNFVLLRQQKPGDWSAPLARLIECLAPHR